METVFGKVKQTKKRSSRSDKDKTKTRDSAPELRFEHSRAERREVLKELKKTYADVFEQIPMPQAVNSSTTR